MWVRLGVQRAGGLALQASLEQEAQLVARSPQGGRDDLYRLPSAGRTLDQAFAELAEANVAAAL